jgi:hypothetical protein
VQAFCSLLSPSKIQIETGPESYTKFEAGAQNYFDSRSLNIAQVAATRAANSENSPKTRDQPMERTLPLWKTEPRPIPSG